LHKKKGHTDAPARLALYYRNGTGGVTQDEVYAANLFKIGAENGNAMAMYYYGKAIQTKRGVDQEDPKLSFHYYTLAVKNGHKHALAALGACWRDGYGCQPNAKQAFECFKLAAPQQCKNALYNLGLAYSRGEGTNVNHKQAFRNFKLAYEQAHTRATYELGCAYLHGKGVKQDVQKAIELFGEAAKAGDEQSQVELNNLK
jgi:TPR repeat protein